jgi:hypothetical protein
MQGGDRQGRRGGAVDLDRRRGLSARYEPPETIDYDKW